jgi:hypothetical protein
MTWTEHADGLWTRAQPHTMMGLHLGTRMTVVRLPSGSLLVHSPISLTPEQRGEVEKRGEVKYIVAPNLYHHSYAKEWADAFPGARVHAAAKLREKRPDLRIDADLGRDDFEGSLIPVHIDGCALDETVFVHPASRSIVSADLTENFTRCDHAITRAYLRAGGIYQRIGWSRLLRVLYRDRKAARRSIERLLEHDVDRCIIAHGEVIETGARAAITQTFEFLD